MFILVNHINIFKKLSFGFILKYTFVLLLLVSGSILTANNCNLPKIETSYQRLCEIVDASEPVDAIELADSLLLYLKKSGNEDCSIYLWIQYKKGEAIELQQGQIEVALRLYYDLVRVAEKKSNWELAAQVYISIARTHEIINRPEDCLRNLKIARKIIEKHKLQGAFSRFTVRYASYHRIFGNLDTAQHYALQAIKLGKKHKVQRSELDGNLLMGILSKDLEESIAFFQEAVHLYLIRKSFYGAAYMKTNIASKYINNGNLKQAAVQLDMAYYYTDQISKNYTGYHGVRQAVYSTKARLFELQGKTDSSFYYQKKSLEAKGKEDYNVNQKEISRMEAAFSKEKEQEKLRHQRKQTTFFRIGLILTGVIIIILAFAIFNDQKKKRFINKQKDLISEKNVELTKSLHQQSILLSEVHHRVKNNLQLVISLLTLEGNKSQNTNMPFNYEEISNKVQSISLIHEQLYKTEEFEKINLKSYFSDLISYFKVLQSHNQSIEIELQIEKITLNLETVLPLGIICSELISNSLKYAILPGKQLKIILLAKMVENKFLLHYTDNGPGYPDGTLLQRKGSMGWMLIKSMVRQLQAESSTNNDSGATFSLLFHEKQVSKI